MTCVTPYAGDYGNVYRLEFRDDGGELRDLTGLSVDFLFVSSAGAVVTVAATLTASTGVAEYTVINGDGVQSAPGVYSLQGRAYDGSSLRLTARPVVVEIGTPLDWV